MLPFFVCHFGQIRSDQKRKVEICRAVMHENSQVRVVYASETGTSEDLAYSLFGLMKRCLLVNVTSMESYDVTKLPDEDIVVFVVSTTGDGEVPSSMLAFWKFLLQKHLSSTSLSSVKVAVFGLGDSSYEKYNAAARRLMVRMKQLGAKELVPLGLGDDQHTHGYFTGYLKWLKDLGAALDVPLSEMDDANGGNVEEENASTSRGYPSVAADMSEYTVEVSESSLDNEIYASIYDSTFPRPRLSYRPPHGCRLQGKSPLYARVKNTTRMTSEVWPQVVQDITLDISAYAAMPNSGLPVSRQIFKSWPPYKTGDVATIYPANPLPLVEKMLSMIHQVDDFSEPRSQGLPKDMFVSVFRNRMAVKGGEFNRKSRLGNVSCSLLDMFTRYLDIGGTPRRSFFLSLSAHATKEEEKDKLRELSSAEGFSLFHEYVVREKRNYVEVMEEFASARPPLSWLLEMVPPLEPRHYSIASSPMEDPTRVGLCVAVEERVTPYGRRRQGLCSSYLASARVGEEVVLWLREGSFTDPGPGAPVIMIGPGTGVAPMRAIFRERQLYSRRMNSAAEAGLPDTFLFFGCRKKERDYLYGQEWSSLRASHDPSSFAEHASGIDSNGIRKQDSNNIDDEDHFTDGSHSVSTAFSQDGPSDQGKTYVMHKMKQHGSLIYTLLAEHAAHFFVAGSAQRMPSDVRNALRAIVKEQCECSEEYAERFVKGLEKSGRYRVEAWSS